MVDHGRGVTGGRSRGQVWKKIEAEEERGKADGTQGSFRAESLALWLPTGANARLWRRPGTGQARDRTALAETETRACVAVRGTLDKNGMGMGMGSV